MQNVFVEKPYQFVPRIKSSWQQKLLLKWPGLFERTLRKQNGVVDFELRNVERLQASIDAGHGIILTPNHPRTADPMAMYHLSRATRTPLYTMASWHLFNRGWLSRRVIRWMGAFSVNREGVDRQAIDEAIEILVNAERPLVMFAEGTTSRTNDQLMALMEGPAFIARTAAKRRAKKSGGKIFAHPVTVKYFFKGDIHQAADEVLSDLEQRLTWNPQTGMPLVERITKMGNAMLSLKEMQYGISVASGASVRERQTNLVNHLLCPLEREWLSGERPDDGVAVRIKNLRSQIFPEISRSELGEGECARRWKQMADSYLAQQIDLYPGDYVARFPSVDRILETCEKFEEDMTDEARIHGNLKVVLDVGEAIEVETKRDKSASEDPLITQIRTTLESTLAKLQTESRMLDENTQ